MKTYRYIFPVFVILSLLSAMPVPAALEDFDYGADRVGGPPSYRNYDKLSSYQNQTYSNSSYVQEDANYYWADRFNNDAEPDARESNKIGLDILDLEQETRQQ
jgi:hypothetical protein